MDILIGIGILLVLIMVIIFEVYLVRLIKDSPLRDEPKTEEKPHRGELTKEQKERQEELRKAFENLMGYGYNDALKKKE